MKNTNTFTREGCKTQSQLKKNDQNSFLFLVLLFNFCFWLRHCPLYWKKYEGSQTNGTGLCIKTNKVHCVKSELGHSSRGPRFAP
jgi:hypothetical protein